MVPTDMRELQNLCLADSRHWFPNWEHGSMDEIVHFGLGIAGEAGEVVEHIKKHHRGDQLNVIELGRELADVTIYVMNLAAALDIDLAAAMDEKRERNIDRWGHP